jgi:hypothetical protein
MLHVVVSIYLRKQICRSMNKYSNLPVEVRLWILKIITCLIDNLYKYIFWSILHVNDSEITVNPTLKGTPI